MRILHVITRLILGGAQQNTVMSCKAQVDAGHEVHLAYGPIHGPEGSLLEEAQASGATLHEIKPMVRELSPLNDWRCYKDLCELVRSVNPDLVHSHSSKAGILARVAAWNQRRDTGKPLSSGGLPASEKDLEIYAQEIWRREFDLKPKVIHTVHGLPFHDKQNALVHRMYVALERYAAKRCDRLVAITPAMIKAFKHKNITHPGKFRIIPSGIDVQAFTPQPERRHAVRAKYGIPQDALVIGHVGRLDPLKGHADLLDQLPRLREGGDDRQFSNRDVWLLFVGDGFHRAELEKNPNMALGKTVMTGLVPLSSVPEHLAAMDVMALPSYQEGQSRTLCEALLCGVPVVGYDVGGISSVIRDGETGRLVPVGDRAALGRAVLDLLDDPQYLAGLAERGRRHVVEHFSAAKMNRELLELYEQLLCPPSSGETRPPAPEAL